MPEPINPLLRLNITTGKVIPKINDNVQSPKSTPQGKESFSDIFKKASSQNSEIKYSAHALKRLQERNITLSADDISSIKNAVRLAGDKGVRDSLVVIKDVALIVNIPNATVVTAVDKESMKNNVFTNIDGAVFI